MMILLRSLFVAKPEDDPALFFENLLVFAEANLTFEVPEDKALWNFIQGFAQTHTHVPGIGTITTHFERIKEVEVLDRLNVLVLQRAVTKGDFIRRVEAKAEDKKIFLTQELLRDAATITTVGLDIKDKKSTRHVRGAVDAIDYIIQNASPIMAPTFGSRLSGEVTTDGQGMEDQYLKRKNDPLAGIGQFTGLQQMDVALKGAKRTELWIHGAFTGGLKSIFLANWVYSQAVYYKHSSAIWSLEMPYFQYMDILYTMHSFHEKFRGIRHRLGLQQDPRADVSLDYEQVKFGTLSPQGEEFFRGHVIPDFNDPKNRYGRIFIEVADPNKDDFTVADLRASAERIFAKNRFAMIGVDHTGLLAPRKSLGSTSESQNAVLRDLKKLALHFNRGEGIAVVALHQISRDGFKLACKRRDDGKTPSYELTSLAYANECERSADIVTTSFVDDTYKANNRVLFQNLKTRDLGAFDPFEARVEWPCKRLLTCMDGMTSNSRTIQVDTADAEAEALAKYLET